MRAAVYARKSTEQSGVAEDQKSVARQVEHARAFALARGWTVDDEHVFLDDGISGAEFANRPGFLRLMNALKPRPAFQVLVMSEESRLGREAIETAYALKQIVTAGVQVWFYLEQRQRTLDSPTDKIMLSLTAFADELEREKARQRTYDAMSRKARAGHVTGGRVFGYDNVEIRGVDGRRSHVVRKINDAEAAIVRRIFELSKSGHGVKSIAKQLNADQVASPRAQRGRSQSWAPSSVREVLYRELYRGRIQWNRTRKRNQWGLQKQVDRPASDWLELDAPELTIVTDELWQTVHQHLSAKRSIYLATDRANTFGRPPSGNPSKYLLTNLAECGCCGGKLKVRSRPHGKSRKHFYGCSTYHDRGRTVCPNGADVPVEEADAIVLDVLLDDVLSASIVQEAVDQAVLKMTAWNPLDQIAAIDRELGQVTRERDRLVTAIATDGEALETLMAALKAREDRRKVLEAQRHNIAAQQRLMTSDAAKLREEIEALAGSWRTVLVNESPEHARPIVSALLKGRVTFTPIAKKTKQWSVRGESSIKGLFCKAILSRGMASPTGFDASGQVFEVLLAA